MRTSWDLFSSNETWWNGLGRAKTIRAEDVLKMSDVFKVDPGWRSVGYRSEVGRNYYLCLALQGSPLSTSKFRHLKKMARIIKKHFFGYYSKRYRESFVPLVPMKSNAQ